MKKSFICLALGLAYCAVLTGCGGDSSPSIIMPTPTPTPSPTPTPVATLEQRVDTAVAQSEATTEAVEPESVDAATVTEPENTEPKSL